MKFILLASNSKLYSNRRILKAAKEAGHNISFVNIKDCYINITSNKPEIYYKKGKKLENIDAVIPRIKPAMTFYGTTIVRQFEMMNIYCLNNSLAITSSRDKLNTLQLLSRDNLPMPTTSFSHSVYETQQLMKMVGGSPLVIKLLEGTKGIGVVLAESNKAAESVINAFKSLKANILVQEYIKESKGRDIRCFVVGDRVVAAMERRAEEGEFRANMHLGGKAMAVEITNEEREIAIKAVKIIGLDIAGVDMVRSNSGPKILEINSSPGLEGIESASGVDVAGEIIKFLTGQIQKNS
jgi:ribosomal protein S6--L-glutamate ligase